MGALTACQNTAANDRANVAIGEDGTVAVSDITLPGQAVPIPGDCDAETTQAAKATCTAVKVATGSADNDGYDEAMQILMADDMFAASGGNEMKMGGPPSDRQDGDAQVSPDGRPPGGGSSNSGPPPGGFNGRRFDGNVNYSNGSYFLAFLGKPSATDTWTLQFGGHHLAVNVTYKGGKVG